MRILHIAAPAPAGGLERVVQGLAVGHHRRGHQVGVLVILDEGVTDHPFLDPLREAGVPLHLLPLPSHSYLAERRAVRDLCRSFRPDVVHTHGCRCDVVDRGVAAGLGIATVTTVHGRSFIGGIKGRIQEWMQRMQYRNFDATVAVSNGLIEETLQDGVPRHRLHLVPNAWGAIHHPLDRDEARRRLGLPLDQQVVGWVGRLIPVKGADVFIEAIGRLPAPRPIIAVIGHGPEGGEIRRRVAALGLEAEVRYFENVNAAGPLFSAFDTYVLSSRSEGLPVVLMEAMAAGVPIVATRVGGVPDALRETDAFLVPPEDPLALSAAIQRSLSDRAEAAARAASARDRLEAEFAPDTWLERYESIYRTVWRQPNSVSRIPSPATR